MDCGLSHRRRYRALRLCVVSVLAVACALASAYAKQSPTSKHGSAKTSKTVAKKTTSKKPGSKTAKTTPAHRRTASAATSAGVMHNASSKKSLRRKKSTRVRGQQKIDSERAQAIQEALIREHYLTGEPTSTWNAASEEAMRRYQADNGWQSKTVPDSRALIKLGLGPSKDHLLNPDSAMTTVPDPPKATSVPTTSNSPTPVAGPATPAPVANSAATTAASPNSTPATSNSTDPQ